jgi:hypothetical protein
MLRLLLALVFAMAITMAGCGGGGDSTAEPTEGTPSASEDDGLLSYQLAFIEVQEAVGEAGFGVAEGLLEFEACVTDEECGDAILLVADEYVPYVAILDDQIRVMNEINPPPTYRSLHENFIEQLGLRQEAGQLWIDGADTLDAAKLTLSQEKFRESQAVYLDILDDLQELFGE